MFLNLAWVYPTILHLAELILCDHGAKGRKPVYSRSWIKSYRGACRTTWMSIYTKWLWFHWQNEESYVSNSTHIYRDADVFLYWNETFANIFRSKTHLVHSQNTQKKAVQICIMDFLLPLWKTWEMKPKTYILIYRQTQSHMDVTDTVWLPKIQWLACNCGSTRFHSFASAGKEKDADWDHNAWTHHGRHKGLC